MSTAVAVPDDSGTGINRYIQFVHDASKKTKQPYLDAGGKLPGFALVGGGMLLPLGGNKIDVGIVASTKLLTRKDNTGKIVKGYRIKDFPGKVGKNKSGFDEYAVAGEPKPYDEHYFVLALLRTGGNLCPVTMNFFSGPSARGIANAHNNLPIAQDAERWAKTPGLGFQESAKASGAAGRFVATIVLETKANANNGNTYVTGRCNIRPTTEAEVAAYNDLSQEPQFLADALVCQASYDKSIKRALGELKDDEGSDTQEV